MQVEGETPPGGSRRELIIQEGRRTSCHHGASLGGNHDLGGDLGGSSAPPPEQINFTFRGRWVAMGHEGVTATCLRVAMPTVLPDRIWRRNDRTREMKEANQEGEG